MIKVDELDLIEPALSAAREVAAKFPNAVFTSGRRSAADQARAMSANVRLNSHWISQTYKPTASSAQLQAWVSTHLKATREQIEAGLLSVMLTWDDAHKRALSKHFSGEAFDVQPCDDAALLAHLESMPGMTFLSHEGGLVRWHAQVS